MFPRRRATGVGLVMGVLFGVGNHLLALDFSLRPELFFAVGAALIVVLFLHEGVHGAAGWLLGHRPEFGFEPPLVFTTFREKIPRGHLIVIALAPLVTLDALFVGLYFTGTLELFAAVCVAINTIGAIGDVWIVARVLPQARGSVIQDTKSGVEVWRAAPATSGNS